MIERTCLRMHCTWNATGVVDVGIDGFIEMFDRRTGDALGKHLAVQSKAVSSLANDTGDTFDFSCNPRDMSYCQIWCTEGWSCDGPAVLGDLDTVVELDPLDHFAELPEAA